MVSSTLLRLPPQLSCKAVCAGSVSRGWHRPWAGGGQGRQEVQGSREAGTLTS